MTTHPDLTTAAAYMDEAMKAIALAKQALLGGAGGALFVSSGPDLAAAQASPGNPYGSSVPLASLRDREHYDAGGVEPAPLRPFTSRPPGPMCAAVRHSEDPWMCTLDAGHDGDHEAQTGGDPVQWPQDAGSAAEVAEGVDVPTFEPVAEWQCDVKHHRGFICTRRADHKGDHAAIYSSGDLLYSWPQEATSPDFCPARWGEPPETMLCSLASGHDGNHATAEGIEWGGRWETAEPHGGAR